MNEFMNVARVIVNSLRDLGVNRLFYVVVDEEDDVYFTAPDVIPIPQRLQKPVTILGESLRPLLKEISPAEAREEYKKWVIDGFEIYECRDFRFVFKHAKK